MLLPSALLALCLALAGGFSLHAQTYVLKSNVPYAETPQERQVLDIYAPKDAKKLPVMFGFMAVDGKPAIRPKSTLSRKCLSIAA